MSLRELIVKKINVLFRTVERKFFVACRKACLYVISGGAIKPHSDGPPLRCWDTLDMRNFSAKC